MQQPSIGVLEALEPPVAVCIVGRVIQSETHRALVQDDTGCAWVDVFAPEGAWVRVQGQWDGSGITDAQLNQVQPSKAFGTRGEWQWFQAQDGRRARLIRARSLIQKAVRSFFDAKDYLEVETPLLIAAPGTDVHLEPFALQSGDSPASRWLSTSPEFHMKRLLAGGFPRIFQFAKCFRQEEEGQQHQPEFTMVEWYHSFLDIDGMIDETEALIGHVAQQVSGDFSVMRGGHTISLAAPWERLTVSDAFQRYANAPALELAENEEQFFRALVEDVEPNIGRDKPTVLTEWPARFAALAALCPHDPRVAQRFEAYAGGLELCNGYGELTDSEEQTKRFKADLSVRENSGKPVFPLDQRFLSALEEGMPPCSGNALGFDRLVMLLLESDSIEDVVCFSKSRL